MERDAAGNGAPRAPSGRYLVGIDVGGTFTDGVAYEPATGRLLRTKVATTADQSAGNDTLGRVAAGADLPAMEELVADLDSVLEPARALKVPATTFEVGRHTALARR